MKKKQFRSLEINSKSEESNEINFNGLRFNDNPIYPISELKENPNNPFKLLDKEDYERLKQDIKERGIIDPLIIDENNMLLTGHNRLMIARELNLKTIPVRVLVSKISATEKQKLLVLDNLNRRQLTPKEKEDFIKLIYGKEIEKDHRGGNRRSKVSSDTFESKNTAKKISEEMGISEITAKRIVSKIRKEIKPKKEIPMDAKSNKGNITDKNLKHRWKEIEKQLKDLKKEYEKKVAPLEKEKSKIEKKLSNMRPIENS